MAFAVSDSKLRYEVHRLRERRWPAPLRVHLRRWYWIFVRRYPLEICHTCGRPVGRCTGSWWHADDALWLQVTGDPNGVVCPVCFTEAADRLRVFVHYVATVEDRRDG